MSHAKIINIREAVTTSDSRWTIGNVLEGLGLLWSEPGAGKTFVACSMAASVATGRHWMGHRTVDGPVVYIAGEGGQASIARRLDAALTAIRIDPEEYVPLWIVTPGVDLVSGTAELLETMGNVVPRLVIVDTLSRCFGGGDEDKTQDMARFVRTLDQVRSAYGCSVLVIHHPNKATDKAGAAKIRGNSALYGAVDVCIHLQPQGREEGILTADKLRDRDVAGELAAIRFDSVPVYGELDEMGSELTTRVVRPTVEFERAVTDCGIALLTSGARTYADWYAATAGKYQQGMFSRVAVAILSDPGTWGMVERAPGIYGRANT